MHTSLGQFRPQLWTKDPESRHQNKQPNERDSEVHALRKRKQYGLFIVNGHACQHKSAAVVLEHRGGGSSDVISLLELS
jgi:hypothetical protein